LVQLGGGRVGQWTVWLVGDSGMQWAVGHGLVYWWDRQTLNQWDRAPVGQKGSEKLGSWRVGGAVGQQGSESMRTGMITGQIDSETEQCGSGAVGQWGSAVRDSETAGWSADGNVRESTD
jgi:hypothetical protein